MLPCGCARGEAQPYNVPCMFRVLGPSPRLASHDQRLQSTQGNKGDQGGRPTHC